jgi:hypothetical protein
MRFTFLVAAALSVALWSTVEAHGQAGRYVPAPRIPGGGGGGVHFPIHVPVPGGSSGNSGGSGDSDVFWVIAAVVGIVALTGIGWKLGQQVGQTNGPARPNTWQSMSSSSVPPLQDLILQPGEVADKARKTTLLLEALARRNDAFDPSQLRAFITTTFTRVQQCWEARDYSPVRELLGPAILAQHEELLRAMRRNREVNLIEDLRVQRLEFVHVSCPAEADRHEVTALITFEAKVYFVNERSRAYLRGSQTVIPYQEFWIFRRYNDSWRLETIDRSHESDRLTAANNVGGMTDRERRNAEDGVLVL